MLPVLNRAIGLVAITAVAIMGIIAALQLLLKSPFWGDGTASAVGTFGTFVAALFLAYRSERQRRREGIDRAIIAAATIKHKVFLAYDNLMDLQSFVYSDKYNSIDRVALSRALGVLNKVHFWTDEDVLPLVVLPHRIAARLIKLRIQLEEIKPIYAEHATRADQYKGMRNQGIEPNDQHENLKPIAVELSVICEELDKLIGEIYSPLGWQFPRMKD